ncbi:ribbon-helix-helix domain-containing protein [Nitrosopumilus ureiphilus]|uniref:Uncharacterized protein n=1 Tax=Nitrosopumilus ureiphilus TaxID=1470067 RepID=A0A7D5R7B3_9ARCH|nr:ribbon-helix-helix domain-containing protein [Nitrosopumilus ureiphilus]QLH06659.1 hypothetical protein C5F50_05905 [Nitrosopumilus ureiphilus]
MDKTKWKSIMLPKELIDQLEKFSESNVSRNLGFTNKSQMAAYAVRDFLKHYSSFMAYLELMDVESDFVILMDYKIGTTVKVKDKNGKLTCSKHKDQCEHMDFVSMIPRVQNLVK